MFVFNFAKSKHSNGNGVCSGARVRACRPVISNGNGFSRSRCVWQHFNPARSRPSDGRTRTYFVVTHFVSRNRSGISSFDVRRALPHPISRFVLDGWLSEKKIQRRKAVYCVWSTLTSVKTYRDDDVNDNNRINCDWKKTV